MSFEREAAVMATVSHANIVNVIDRETVDDQPWLAMEYLEGGSIRDRMIPGEPLDIQTAREVLSSVAAALATLHRQGLIHRDVKPDNVLFDQSGQVKLCDFGISVPVGQTGHLTDVDTSPGTIDYMAPEQRYRLDVSQSANQYSFAVMAYELLTGFVPPRVFRPASAKNPALNDRVDSVMEQALSEEPKDRFTDVQRLFEALDAALSHPAEEDSATSAAPHAGDRQGFVVAVCVIVLIVGAMSVYLAATRGGLPHDGESTQVPGGTEPIPTEQVQQAGALIWRSNADNEPEVLIVRARSGGHWTVPKANQPDDLPQTSVAEEEAFEEAGIRGTTSSTVLGSYQYKRKGRIYSVAVVPVKASEVMDVWTEDFRSREWHSITDASEQFADDDLRAMVASLNAQVLSGE